MKSRIQKSQPEKNSSVETSVLAGLVFSRSELHSVEDSVLFKGMDGLTLSRTLEILNASTEEYGKGSMVHRPFTGMTKFGLVLSGLACAFVDDIEGRRTVMTEVTPGRTFGESLSFLRIEDSPVYIIATEYSRILWLSPEILFSGGDDLLQMDIQKRFTSMLAERTLAMNNRIQVLSKSKLRDRIITYFSELSSAGNTGTFNVPLNREDMAAYIGTDRSALSRELSRMKADGIIDFYKNSFRILK